MVFIMLGHDTNCYDFTRDLTEMAIDELKALSGIKVEKVDN